MSDIKEFEIDSRDHFSKSMYLTKFFLKDNKKIFEDMLDAIENEKAKAYISGQLDDVKTNIESTQKSKNNAEKVIKDNKENYKAIMLRLAYCNK